MRRVVFVFHDADYYSGGTRSLLDLLDDFVADNNFECIAIVPDEEGTAVGYLKEKNVEVIYSKYYQISYLTDEGFLKHIYRLPKRLKRLWTTLVNGKKLAKDLEHRDIDVVYSNTGFIITGMLIKKYIDRITHIWHLREFGEEDHHFGIFFGRRIYYHLLNKYTDNVIMISEALSRKFTPYIIKPRTTIIYDDVSEKYIQPIHEMYCKDEPLNILMAGLICEGKGQIQALQAVKILKNQNIPVKLFLAGSFVNQQYKALLEEFVSTNNLNDEVEFMGLVKDMNSLRAKVKFGIVASSSEAFGRVTIEGMLSGLCMIGANRGGTKELIRNNKTGLLYEHGDNKQLAQILYELYLNPELVNKIRNQGFSEAIKYTQGNCSANLKQLMLDKR